MKQHTIQSFTDYIKYVEGECCEGEFLFRGQRLALCDQLEEKIRSTCHHARQLTEFIIHHLLAG